MISDIITQEERQIYFQNSCKNTSVLKHSNTM